MMRLEALLLLTVATAIACNKESDAQQTEPALSDATETAPLTDEVVDQAELPVAEDFEDEAFAAIDEDNLEDRIDALEKEIASDAE